MRVKVCGSNDASVQTESVDGNDRKLWTEVAKGDLDASSCGVHTLQNLELRDLAYEPCAHTECAFRFWKLSFVRTTTAWPSGPLVGCPPGGSSRGWSAAPRGG